MLKGIAEPRAIAMDSHIFCFLRMKIHLKIYCKVDSFYSRKAGF